MSRSNTWLAAIAPALLLMAVQAAGMPPADPEVQVPLGLVPIQWPADNLYSKQKVDLGRLLYFDNRLSADNSVSCASCHHPKFAFADGSAVSVGIKGQKGGRSAPTVFNRAYSLAQFWDGRVASLEDQAKGPMENPVEMGNTHAGVVARVIGIPGYKVLFEGAFGAGEINIDQVAKAIATYERTVLSGNSPYDRYRAGKKNAMTANQVRGYDVFVNKAKCDQCHEGINFTTNAYHNLGVGTDRPNPDEGRSAITKNPADWGAFKTPTLREIANTAPYMHDGSLTTLRDVVDYYDKGGLPNKNLDEKIKPLHLTEQNKNDLVDFLKALSGEGWQSSAVPTKFPE